MLKWAGISAVGAGATGLGIAGGSAAKKILTLNNNP
jgi:hypothetical protein